MKSFKQFILETPTFDAHKFSLDCKFILDELRKDKFRHIIWRGESNNVMPSDFTIRTWSERRFTRDTKKEIHDALNEYFMKRFGDPIRNWLFCTGDIVDARYYSANQDVAAVFPIGKFEWYCSEDIHDMLGLIIKSITVARDMQKSDNDIKIIPYAIDLIINQLEKTKFWKNTNLIDCLKSDNEMMIKCDRYYLFNRDGESFNSPEMDKMFRTVT